MLVASLRCTYKYYVCHDTLLPCNFGYCVTLSIIYRVYYPHCQQYNSSKTLPRFLAQAIPCTDPEPFAQQSLYEYGLFLNWGIGNISLSDNYTQKN